MRQDSSCQQLAKRESINHNEEMALCNLFNDENKFTLFAISFPRYKKSRVNNYSLCSAASIISSFIFSWSIEDDDLSGRPLVEIC